VSVTQYLMNYCITQTNFKLLWNVCFIFQRVVSPMERESSAL